MVGEEQVIAFLEVWDTWGAWLRQQASDVRTKGEALLHRVDQSLGAVPALNNPINQHMGFNAALLQAHTLENLQYWLETRQVNVGYNEDGYNALSFAAGMRCDQQERITLLLEQGVPVNTQSKKMLNRTPLHCLIADENPLALFLIGEVQRLGIALNLGLSDGEGYTPLLLAAKTRQERTALCVLNAIKNQEGIINARDVEGRTALDYALILGQTSLIGALWAAGGQTSVVDPLFSNREAFGEEAIREILRSVGIDSRRDQYATRNYIHDRYGQKPVSITKDPSDPSRYSMKHAVESTLPSMKNDAIAKEIKRMMDPEVYLLDRENSYRGMSDIGSMTSEDKAFIQSQYNSFSGCSLLEHCLTQQNGCWAIFKEQFSETARHSLSALPYTPGFDGRKTVARRGALDKAPVAAAPVVIEVREDHYARPSNK